MTAENKVDSGEGLTGEQRERFEEFCDDACLPTVRLDDGYASDDTQAAYEAWQAASAQVAALRESHAELTKAMDRLAHYAECQVKQFSSGRPSLDMTLFPSLCEEARAALARAKELK